MSPTRDEGSIPLIPLQLQRQQYGRLSGEHEPHFDDMQQSSPYSPSPTPQTATFISATDKMRQTMSKRAAAFLISSYVFDWAVIIVSLLVSFKLGNIEPNKRPFFIDNPDISFPFTEHETVPSWLLLTLNAVVPIAVIFLIALVLVPGNTIPPGTPKSLIWKRKLWELHAGWQGLALSLTTAWFITNGMKNLFGKPRPDLIARCNPDIENFSQYVVGGLNVGTGFERLVSADICLNGRDDVSEAIRTELSDGFRSYPSGHASSAAAGLIYLSLFIASKLAITFPFLASEGYRNEATFSAFPSRANHHQQQQQQQQQARGRTPTHLDPEAYELSHMSSSTANNEHLSNHADPATAIRIARHEATLSAVRRQAAAPPIYLLVFAAAPLFTAIFIASSRWFDYRHHGFDILFGFLIGTISAFFAFRFYHLPISQGAGWAWGPRSVDKAWWAGVGSFSYATDREKYHVRAGDEEEAIEGKGKKAGRDGHGTGAHV